MAADYSEAEAAVHDRGGLGLVQSAHRLGDVLGRLRDRRLGHDSEALARARAPEVPEIALADQRLLDEHADLGMAVLGEQVRPEDRLVGHRAHRERERPFAQPLFAPGDTDRWHTEALFDRLACRHGVVRDVRSEDEDAAFVDELAEGVDHRLDASLRKALDLPVHDLNGPVDDLLLQPLVEHQLERQGEVVAQLLRIVGREPEIHQVTDLDRLSGADVRHLASWRGHHNLNVCSTFARAKILAPPPLGQSASITIAMPMPPPAHMETQPSRAPRRRSSWTMLTTIRAPVASSNAVARATAAIFFFFLSSTRSVTCQPFERIRYQKAIGGVLGCLRRLWGRRGGGTT